jgi:hypothetical protein
MEDSEAKVMLPPLRNGSSVDKQSETGSSPTHTKSNSNLWQLVTAATDEK